MAGLSLSALARELGRSKSGLHALAAKGLIPKGSDGTYDADAVRAALARNLEPSRAKPLHGVRPVANAERAVRTQDDARAAVGLILQVLNGEGQAVEGDAPVDFAMARTADTILKAYERDLKMARARKELVPLASVRGHVERAFVGYRQSVQRLPARFGAQIAAEVGCEPSALDAALSRAIATVLDELSSPVVRA